jgi:hypothetical protein
MTARAAIATMTYLHVHPFWWCEFGELDCGPLDAVVDLEHAKMEQALTGVAP